MVDVTFTSQESKCKFLVQLLIRKPASKWQREWASASLWRRMYCYYLRQCSSSSSSSSASSSTISLEVDMNGWVLFRFVANFWNSVYLIRSSITLGHIQIQWNLPVTESQTLAIYKYSETCLWRNRKGKKFFSLPAVSFSYRYLNFGSSGL